MPKESDGRPAYLVVNADESEPGTCKDREIMRHDPHTLIEGRADRLLRDECAMPATSTSAANIIREREAFRRRLTKAYDAGMLGKNAAGSGWDFDLVSAPRGLVRIYLR